MANFNEKLHQWYEQHRRDLPWRDVGDPYLIWISEIILQQTRVDQGLGYYLRFIRRFPDISSLAQAPADEVMKMWEGLGYYSRAMNLHTAAKSVVNSHGGRFPDNYHELRLLKGVGEYTAAAVASIAYGLPYAAVDGNVARVLSRFFGIEEPVNTAKGQRLIRQLANELLDTSNPGRHNQAVMEFGALMCTPGNPDCRKCPVEENCFARLRGMESRLPLKAKSRIRVTRYFVFLVLEHDQSLTIGKRTSDDIWKNLYQLPMVETAMEKNPGEIIMLPEVADILNTPGATLVSISNRYRHILTHREIIARFVHITVKQPFINGLNFFEVHKEEISNFAFPVLIKNYLIGAGMNLH